MEKMTGPATIAFLGCLTLMSALRIVAQSHASIERGDRLQDDLNILVERARPGVFGVSIIDLQSGSEWEVHGDRPFPMLSDFKAPVAAAVLSRIDTGSLSMSRTVTLQPADRVPGSAVPSIGDRLTSGQVTVTVRDLLKATVSQSDNTSVDALLRLIGGPEQVSRFLREKGVLDMRVTAGERENDLILAGLESGSTPSLKETASQEAQRLRKGYRRFMEDPPNCTTPHSAAIFLQKLAQGKLLSESSSRYLLDLMYAQAAWHRLRDGLPAGVRLADKTGTGPQVDGRTSAWNDIGVFTWPNGHAVVVAAFLKDSPASQKERDALFADLARETTSLLP